MKVDILTSLTYMNIADGTTFTEEGITDLAAVGGFVPTINLNPSTKPIAVSIGELVDILNSGIERYLVLIRNDYAIAGSAPDWINSPANRNLKNFYNLFMMSKFNFDTFTGHLVLETKSDYNPSLQHGITPVSPLPNGVCFISSYKVHLQSSDTNNAQDQVRLARLLGLSDQIVYKSGSVIPAPGNIN